MNPEVLVAIIAAALSSVAGGLFSSESVRTLIYKLFKKELPQKTYSERLSELTRSLTVASVDVDAVLREMGQVAKEREHAVKELESGLAALEKRERELQEKIMILQSVPIPVAEHFAKLVEPGEKRSARRDYLLFISGVVVTTIIAVALQFLTIKKKNVEQQGRTCDAPATGTPHSRP